MTDPDRPSAVGHKIVLPFGDYTVAIQTSESTELARHRRWRDTVLFGTALAMFVTVLLVSLWFSFLSDQPDLATRQAAIGIVITLIGALGGFTGGRGAK